MAKQFLAQATAVFCLALSIVLGVVTRAQAADDILVFAAASLKGSLDIVESEWAKGGGAPVKISYAGSSVLAKQIEQGAPADIFISADLDWMNYLAQRKLIKSESRVNLLGNRLVLIASVGSNIALTIAPGFDLAVALHGGRLAMADTSGVPAGKYGKAALEKLGVWSSVAMKVAQAENVRAALAFVARGEAPLGIVYETDAKAEPKVKIIDTFPEDTHPPIVYPIALTTMSKNAEAAAFLTYLSSPTALGIFKAQGFSVRK